MNEELFRGLWSRAVDVDEQLSEEAVPMRARREDVWRLLSWESKAVVMSLGLQEDLTRVAGGVGSSGPDVLWDFFRGGLFL